MRRFLIVTILFSVLLLAGCVVKIPGIEITTIPDEGSGEELFLRETVSYEADSTRIQPDETASEAESSASEIATEETTGRETEESSVAITEERQSTEAEITVRETTTEKPTAGEAESSTEAETDAYSEEITLDISMPEKNGTMVTDKDSDNKYIKIVNKKRGVSSALLVAVFSVPESGQNYVFEYKNENGRAADDIRRVYLIDSDGDITGVAAVSASEKENISAVENWFCMNVLIKEVIYPAIVDDIT